VSVCGCVCVRSGDRKSQQNDRHQIQHRCSGPETKGGPIRISTADFMRMRRNIAMLNVGPLLES
jgi:hypothetical protein